VRRVVNMSSSASPTVVTRDPNTVFAPTGLAHLAEPLASSKTVYYRVAVVLVHVELHMYFPPTPTLAFGLRLVFTAPIHSRCPDPFPTGEICDLVIEISRFENLDTRL
jgi:hypothetical protein